MATETWDLWFPQAGATGVSFARTKVDAEATTKGVLVHAAPPKLEVTVRGADDEVIAKGTELERSAPGPISRLLRTGDEVFLEDCWPSEEDLGLPVILPGGETGVLTAWWHADDKSSWRWSVEFSNHV